MKTNPLELTKKEAFNLSMAYRNQVNNFRNRFDHIESIDVAKAGAEYFLELERLQNKLEKFIDSFGG